MYPNKKQAILLCLLLVVTQFVVAFYLAYMGVRWERGSAIIQVIVSAGSTALVGLWAVSKMRLKFSALFHAGHNRLGYLVKNITFPLIIIAIDMQALLSNVVNMYYQLFPGKNDISIDIDLMAGSGFVGFLALGVVVPLCEEIIFRGIILRGLLSRYTRTDAVFTSALLFSIYHINPEQLLPALIVGLMLGWLYVRSYSLWPSVLLHSLFNSVYVLLAMSQTDVPGISDFDNNQISYTPFMWQVVASITLIMAILWLNRIFDTSFSTGGDTGMSQD